MINRRFGLAILSALSLMASAQVVPRHKETHVLLEKAKLPDKPYLAFPALIDLGSDVLVSYKHGHSHMADPGATMDMLRINGAGVATPCGTIAALDGLIMQMGEWARFPDGSIANYIDAQKKGRPSRVGLRVVRSKDGGKTFGPVERVGVIDGVEYGYAFEAITRGKTTWMLVMTFSNLEGGKFSSKLPKGKGSVDVIRSEDSGASWKFVRSITRELDNAPINESSFALCGDGFIVAARGYDSRQWLMRTDGEFNATRKINLTKENAFIRSHLGRPRVFLRDGSWYLMGRNYIAPKTPMQLSMFRFDPDTFAVTKHVILDNDKGKKVPDGYYAMSYWREISGKTQFNVVTYKRDAVCHGIIRFAYDWEEIR